VIQRFVWLQFFLLGYDWRWMWKLRDIPGPRVSRAYLGHSPQVRDLNTKSLLRLELLEALIKGLARILVVNVLEATGGEIAWENRVGNSRGGHQAWKAHTGSGPTDELLLLG
jgi:hypothetical protein